MCLRFVCVCVFVYICVCGKSCLRFRSPNNLDKDMHVAYVIAMSRDCFVILELIGKLHEVIVDSNGSRFCQLHSRCQFWKLTIHNICELTQYLNKNIPLWIENYRGTSWPANSPDLTILDSFLWGYLRDEEIGLTSEKIKEKLVGEINFRPNKKSESMQ